MEFTKEKLNLEEGLTKEWLITNGIGGFSSATIIGANTRKYHGLLIAPLTPPARRFLILSKLDENLETRGRKYDLYTNVCKEYISHGYNYQESFEKAYVPIFKYKAGGVEISKIICMEYGKNTVVVYYKIRTGSAKAKLTLAPIVNFRDFHTMSTDHNFNIYQDISGNKVKMIIDGNSQTPVYMYISQGKYIKHENDNFKNMFYVEEEKRGFYPEENHGVPGVYEIEIPAKTEKDISFICSFENNIEEIDGKKVISSEIERLEKLFNSSLLIDFKNDKKTKEELENEMLIKTYLHAADNFIVNRPSFDLHTIIAGYPWFLDWGRDSLIAYEGLVLIPKRFDIAKEVLLTLVRDTKFGLVPNGYSGYDNRPLYNSSDASLLLFEQVQKYIDYTGDYKFVKEYLYDVLENIIDSYCGKIDVDENNIYLDGDGLISSGTENTQNTWMDVKYDGKAITPRNGKTVELNSLWYNANMIMADLSRKLGHFIKGAKYKELADNCKYSFNLKFYNKETGCLYDVLGDGKIRPNQLFALSLTYPVLDPQSEEAKSVIKVVETMLLNPYGLKTLAKGYPGYVEEYSGSSKKRDKSYHQGITWVWLLGLYYDSLKNMQKYAKKREEKTELKKKILDFCTKTNSTFKKELFERGCIGGIAEIYDSKPPYLPKGAINQAWSIAEVFRIILNR